MFHDRDERKQIEIIDQKYNWDELSAMRTGFIANLRVISVHTQRLSDAGYIESAIKETIAEPDFPAELEYEYSTPEFQRGIAVGIQMLADAMTKDTNHTIDMIDAALEEKMSRG